MSVSTNPSAGKEPYLVCPNCICSWVYCKKAQGHFCKTCGSAWDLLLDGDYEDAVDDRAELLAAVAALVSSVGDDKAIQLFEQLKEATKTARAVQPEQRPLEAYRKLSRITKEVDAQAALVLDAKKAARRGRG